MLAVHTASFIQFINTEIEEISRGIVNPHHFHNVRCGIESILSLLEYNNDVVDKADQLSRRASDYITHHGLVTSKSSDETVRRDDGLLLAVQEALARFGVAVEHGQPNSRVRTLGLA
jgi:hypothetical protein